jgi:tRNA (guanine37-N1)-methyltransferase
LRVPYIKIHQSEAKREIDRLKRSDKLLRKYKIKSEGDWVLIPVKNSDDTEEFEENVSKRMSHVGSFERISDFFVIKERSGWEKIYEELKEKQSPRAIFLDSGIEGSFRIRKLDRIYGTGGPVGIHKENGLRYAVDLEIAYFSPRLAGLRREITESCHRSVNSGLIVDMYAGVGPISIPLLKFNLNVLSIDMNPEAVKLLSKNMKLNKVDGEAMVADSNQIYECLEGMETVIMNNPTQPLSVTQKIIGRLDRGTIVHTTYISNRKDKTEFEGVDVLDRKIVHGYSPSSSLFYYRLRKK